MSHADGKTIDPPPIPPPAEPAPGHLNGVKLVSSPIPPHKAFPTPGATAPALSEQLPAVVEDDASTPSDDSTGTEQEVAVDVEEATSEVAEITEEEIGQDMRPIETAESTAEPTTEPVPTSSEVVNTVDEATSSAPVPNATETPEVTNTTDLGDTSIDEKLQMYIEELDHMGISFVTAESINKLGPNQRELSFSGALDSAVRAAVAEHVLNTIPPEFRDELARSLLHKIAIVRTTDVMQQNQDGVAEPSTRAEYDKDTGALVVVIPDDFPIANLATGEFNQRPTELTDPEELAYAITYALTIAYIDRVNPLGGWASAHPFIVFPGSDEMKYALMRNEMSGFREHMAAVFATIAAGYAQEVFGEQYANEAFFTDYYSTWPPFKAYRDAQGY